MTSSIHSQSLLEMLRQQRIVVDARTTSEVMEKKRLIVEHQSKFPSKLRPAIIRGQNSVPRTFLAYFYKEVKNFFFGRCDSIAEIRLVHNEELNLPVEWHGLDRGVDTEEEVETAIRFFPWICSETNVKRPPNLSILYARPIHFLLSYSKTVSFVPLFWKLMLEIYGKNVPIRCNLNEILEELLMNSNTDESLSIRVDLREFGYESTEFFGETAELDNECLSILMHLREEDWVHETHINDLLWWFLAHPHRKYREISFIETRLRLLIDWYPNCLTSYERMYRIQDLLGIQNHDAFDLRMFEIIFEMGMSYFPTKLGFVFHKSTVIISSVPPGRSPQIKELSAFQIFCRFFGTERVLGIIHKKLQIALGTNNTLQDLVDSTAVNRHIGLDGLYILVRLNPAAIISGYSTSSKKPFVQNQNQELLQRL